MGGGPGGSATAYHLARRGVDVLMVDKAQFPREKVCGDGLTPRAVKAMWENAESGVAPCQCFSSEGMCTTSPGTMICCSVSVAMMPLPAVTNST